MTVSFDTKLNACAALGSTYSVLQPTFILLADIGKGPATVVLAALSKAADKG